MKGRIIKGVGGFYYVYVPESGIYECRAKGIFRKEGQKPLVGDLVEMEVTDTVDIEGNITRILPRKDGLIRPAVANIDQALVIFAAASPDPNLNLLDRFLVMMEYAHVPVVILINKIDLVSPEVTEKIVDTYRPAGYPVHLISVRENQGIDAVRQMLKGKISAVAGPSGVGKSSLINKLQTATVMETGGISIKLHRGRHTTRHSELIPLGGEDVADLDAQKEKTSSGSDLRSHEAGHDTERAEHPQYVLHNVHEGTFGINEHFAEDDAHVWIPYTQTHAGRAAGFIMDTPGFSSLYVPSFQKEELGDFFPEIVEAAPRCRFRGCAHIHEPDCAVKQAVEDGTIPKSRYEDYVQMYEEIADRRMY